jgi:predicted  nucleic acid-binding Zn-ribbon protein
MGTEEKSNRRDMIAASERMVSALQSQLQLWEEQKKIIDATISTVTELEQRVAALSNDLTTLSSDLDQLIESFSDFRDMNLVDRLRWLLGWQ